VTKLMALDAPVMTITGLVQRLETNHRDHPLAQ
jgi:hypothetical protein